MSNDNKVIPFKVVTSEVKPSDQKTANAEVVAMFEMFLKRAKEGKIQFAAIASVDGEGVANTTWEPEESSPQLVTQGMGAVGYLNYRFGAAVDVGSTED